MQQHNTRDHKIDIYSHELINNICKGDEIEKKKIKKKSKDSK